MESIPLPKTIESKKISDYKSEITIEPLYPGYGTTLGNSLRRVLLSSLPGAAVTAVKVKDINHEFSTIPNVKEDVVDILLNLKQLRIKLTGDNESKIIISASGEKKVTGKDIKKVAGVEIINTDLQIATLTDKAAKFEAELTVNRGRGYEPVEQRENQKIETGTISIDSIYTPVRLVNFEVENVRVGQMTNFNRLKMTIETDGTITPDEGLNQALQILNDHFNAVLEMTGAKEPTKAAAKKKSEKKTAEDKEEKTEEKEEKEVKEEAEVDSKDEPAKKKRGRPKKTEEK